MATPPLPFCSTPGCQERAKGHCQAHRQGLKQERSRFYAGGGTYGRKWRKTREAFLADHPYCCDCPALSNEVDHRIPHRGDQELFWDQSNWQAMCRECHSRKTAKEVGFGGKR